MANVSASQVCSSEEMFEYWAKSVGLILDDMNGRIVETTLPPVLQDLLRASRDLPTWVKDKDAVQYLPFKTTFRSQLDTLQQSLDLQATGCSTAVFTYNEDDQPLSEELGSMLDPILHLCYHTSIMNNRGLLEPNEADWRNAVDHLISRAWSKHDCTKLAHCLDSRLSLPSSALPSLTETKIGSAAVFYGPQTCAPLGMLEKCSSMPAHALGTVALPHWMTQYKRDDATLNLIARRQVQMAMVSALYQRRSLGSLDDFVFGMTVVGSDAFIYAARWIVSQIPQDSSPPADSSAVDPTMNTPAINTSQYTQPLHAEFYPGEIPPGHECKIKMYLMAVFPTMRPLKVISLFLLIRASRTLAYGYWNALYGPERCSRLDAISVRFHQWHAKTPHSTLGSTNTSGPGRHHSWITPIREVLSSPESAEEEDTGSSRADSSDVRPTPDLQDNLNEQSFTCVDAEVKKPLESIQIEQSRGKVTQCDTSCGEAEGQEVFDFIHAEQPQDSVLKVLHYLSCTLQDDASMEHD